MIGITFEEIEYLHDRILQQSGGASGIRDRGAVDSALAQPFMTFDGEDLYPTPVEKAAALGFSLIKNHAFVDSNKRIGYMAMEVFLARNGHEIAGDVDDQESIVLRLAAGEIDRETFVGWLRGQVVESRP